MPTNILPPKINQLFVYPIKSCAGISVASMQFDNKGPLFDRRWMLVDSQTGVFLSQRELPRMALIKTAIEGDAVYARQENNELLARELLLPEDGGLIDVQVWSDCVQGFDCGDEAASWFSQLLGYDCRLVYQGGCERTADQEYAAPGTEISFADGFPLLVVNQGSIEFLNTACAGAEIRAENFRPNIVVENTPAFAENSWSNIMADDLVMTVVKPCQRCVIPTLNPNTAQREKTILPVLLEYCRHDNNIYFGQNLTAGFSKGMSLRVGQRVSIQS